MKRYYVLGLLILFSGSAAFECYSQSLGPAPDVDAVSRSAPAPSPTPAAKIHRNLLKNVIRDQGAIWTAPFRMNRDNMKWFGSFAVTTAALIATDKYTSGWVHHEGSLQPASHDVSWAGSFYSLGSIAGAFYLAGHSTGNNRTQETGFLAAEALIDTEIVTSAIKFATERPRPNFDNGRGRFFTGGRSFVSGHAANSFSVATVIAYEYWDRPLIRDTAFAAAAAVAISRYTGRKHFLSDIVVGSGLGFYIGRYVYKKHHIAASATTDDDDLSQNSPHRMPAIIPYFDRRHSTYGAKLEWSF